MNNRKYAINEHFFDKIDTERSAYFLGWIISDGCITSDYYFSIELNGSDEKILETLANLIYLKEHTKLIKSRGACKLTVGSKKLVSSLYKVGITQAKSLTVTFPTGIQKDVYRHFIRGVFEGDGSIVHYKTRYYLYFLGTDLFLSELKRILKEEIRIKDTKLIYVHKDCEIKRLSITGNKDIYNILQYMYKDAKYILERKLKIANDFIKEYENGSKKERIKSSKYVGVCFDKTRNRWKVTGNKKQLGRYNTEEEAYKRRIEWENTGN